MIAEVLGLLTGFAALAICVVGVYFFLRSVKLRRHPSLDVQGLFYGLMFGLLGVTSVYYSADCMAEHIFLDAHSGRRKHTYSYFGIQLSERVRETTFSKRYEPCDSKQEDPRWIPVGLTTGPFLDVLVSSHGGSIWNSTLQLMRWLDRISPVDEKKECVVLKQILRLVDVPDLGRADHMTACFLQKIRKESISDPEKIKTIRRNCEKEHQDDR